MILELSRNVFHCSVINVLSNLDLPFLRICDLDSFFCPATAFIVYHFVFALSRTFFDFFFFSFNPFVLSATTPIVYHGIFYLSTVFLFYFPSSCKPVAGTYAYALTLLFPPFIIKQENCRVPQPFAFHRNTDFSGRHIP